MSVVQIATKFPYDLYGLWEKDVHDQILLLLKELPPFIVFSAYDDTFPDEFMLRITPVMCYPSIDMSTTSVEDLVMETGGNPSIISDPISAMAVEDVTLGDVMIKHEVSEVEDSDGGNLSIISDPISAMAVEDVTLDDVMIKHEVSEVEDSDYALNSIVNDVEDSDYALNSIVNDVEDSDYALNSIVNDVYLKYLCRFVINVTRLSTYRSTVLLRSFVKYMFAKHGTALHYDAIFPHDYNILPKKHSRIELTSEMMKCNYDLYSKYKYGHSIALLEPIISAKSNKLEVEYAICGLVYTVLSDSVVTDACKLWCFINGLWVECSSDGYLWNFITNELIQYLLSEGADSVASHVKSVHTRGRMLKDVKLRLDNDSFETLLDSRNELIRMTNGVLNTSTLSLSQAVPSDYVSVAAAVPYEVFDSTSSQVAQLMHILRSIFTNNDVLEFFLLSCSTFLEGFNANKVFYIWWGSGNNAKSLVQTLLMKTFGEYCSTAPTSLITGKRTGASNATPELCHVEKRLVVFLQEPNPDEKIKAGMIKELTGNDRMYTRQLFKSGKTMMFKAKLVLVCNNILEIPGMDAALRRRITVLPFTSTFLDPREYSVRSQKRTLEPDSHIINPVVEKQLIACGPAFMYLVCKRYHESIGHEFNVPQIIQDTTIDYLTRNNYQLIFIKRFIHAVYGSRTAITELYEMFKDWFKRSYPGKRVVDSEVFTAELSNEGFQNKDGVIDNSYNSYHGDLFLTK